jgi:acyl-CoA synthetase (NDP forming)
MPLAESLKLLQKSGVPTAKWAAARNEQQAVAAAKKIGFPVAVKIDSPDILHKTEKKAVAFGLRNENELREGVKKILANAKKARARVSSIVVQESLSGIETIVGTKQDAQFGPVVVFGLGGVFVEVFDDVAVRVAPVSAREAGQMIKEIKAYPILSGARGMKPVNEKAIADVIVKASKLAEKGNFKELDINPLFASEKTAKAADARVIL